MTIGQAQSIMTLNAIIKWSLLVMIAVLIIAIVQYTRYQPWWKDPIGITIVGLEAAMLAEIVPQEFAQWFVHSVGGTIELGYVAVILSMFVTLALIARVIVWWIEQRRAARPQPESREDQRAAV